jgi:L-ascorbate metabolism protein UlaG (beta-lactamase superfamily)
VSDTADTLEWVGHATVVLDLDGTRLVTDPLLRNRVAHLRRAVPLVNGAPRGVDAILVSHGHWDHLDLPSLERVGKTMPVVVPRGLGRLLRRRGFERVAEVEPGDELTVRNLAVQVVPAKHRAWRGPFRSRDLSVGYVVRGSRAVYFAGDTDLFDSMADIASPDVALLPVWGWGPTVSRGHLDPTRAARALTLLRPKLVIPIHWGTYFPFQRGLRRVPWFLHPPPLEFASEARRLAPATEVRVLRQGESLELSSL